MIAVFLVAIWACGFLWSVCRDRDWFASNPDHDVADLAVMVAVAICWPMTHAAFWVQAWLDSRR